MALLTYAVFASAILIFILTFTFMFSTRARGKMMSNQIKSVKYMMDDSKEDLRHIASDMADAAEDGFEKIRNALSEEEEIYCKYCGSRIDADSRYCKHCGKEQ